MEKIIMGRNRNFPITFRYGERTALKATTADEALLWDKRRGYLNFQSLNLLHQKNMVGGVAWRAKEILELVHTNFYGPMRSPSHGYSSKSKAYRLYSLKTKNVIVSRDVIFDENSSWNWEEEKKEGTSFPTNNMQDEALVESDENQPSQDEVPSEEPDEESQSPPPQKFVH
ncbi:retrovirus-related pol polyprotein from transposon TNT 1-94 [Tanacetum coccineum]